MSLGFSLKQFNFNINYIYIYVFKVFLLIKIIVKSINLVRFTQIYL